MIEGKDPLNLWLDMIVDLKRRGMDTVTTRRCPIATKRVVVLFRSKYGYPRE